MDSEDATDEGRDTLGFIFKKGMWSSPIEFHHFKQELISLPDVRCANPSTCSPLSGKLVLHNPVLSSCGLLDTHAHTSNWLCFRALQSLFTGTKSSLDAKRVPEL